MLESLVHGRTPPQPPGVAPHTGGSSSASDWQGSSASLGSANLALWSSALAPAVDTASDALEERKIPGHSPLHEIFMLNSFPLLLLFGDRS